MMPSSFHPTIPDGCTQIFRVNSTSADKIHTLLDAEEGELVEGQADAIHEMAAKRLKVAPKQKGEFVKLEPAAKVPAASDFLAGIDLASIACGGGSSSDEEGSSKKPKRKLAPSGPSSSAAAAEGSPVNKCVAARVQVPWTSRLQLLVLLASCICAGRRS